MHIKFTFFFIIIFGGLCAYQSTAQILKVNNTGLDTDSSNYFVGSMDVNLNINNRSTTAEKEVVFKGLTGAANLLYTSTQHAYILINSINYFTSTGGPVISTGFTHFRINFLRKRKLSYELFTQIQYDDGRNMPLRFLQGGGLRLNLIKTKNAQLNMGIGVMHEQEHWKLVNMDNAEIIKNIWKTSDYISANVQLNDYLNFNLITYYQGGYDSNSDIFRNRVSGDLVITVKVNSKLAMLTSFTGQYENKPVIPINNFVYSLTNGIQWNF